MSITKTFKNHRGQLHVMNTALVALTSLYVIGAAVALSAPYWVSATSALAPLAAFAATPLGIGILATVSVALIGLAVYSIIKNNKISEEKAPKVVADDQNQPVLMLTQDVFEQMKENNKHENKDGKVIEGKYCIYFTNSEGKECRVIVDNNIAKELGNTLLSKIDSLEVKKDDGEYVSINDKSKQLEELGLNQNGAKEFNTYLGSVVVEQAASQEQKK
ncbi:hypothetical protein HET73_02770 [Wolbachia endosymbiont of Atemnus politus]|uniref:hypothetical protein n=1 Tax=Wolbachia endosymbiont of Atemnus politus TaxID=2682840 RepID=UPI0015726DD5|nr:hypothetical protein [Wolbachia endosymbiont of Atemnus politus]NSM56486.1 hypothetical protein [Wolbachia endosymbiont of Atemnus politus]